MLYSQLLAKAHEVLEERLKALSGQEMDTCTVNGAQIHRYKGNGVSTSLSSAGADDDPLKKFGDSIKNWRMFPDTHVALRVLAEHFKLVVLSNVDRTSFRHTHALLSEGIASNPDIALYTYPDDNPHKFWHPQATMGSQSPFILILTAQDTGCYKPDLGGFNAALDYIHSNPALFGDLGKEDVRSFVLSVAQSLQHDHVAARRLGIRSVWIDRQSAVTCNELPRDFGEVQYWTWRFETLGEMADAVRQEIAASRAEQPVDDPADP